MSRFLPAFLAIGSAIVVAVGCGDQAKVAQNRPNSANSAADVSDAQRGQESGLRDPAESDESVLQRTKADAATASDSQTEENATGNPPTAGKTPSERGSADSPEPADDDKDQTSDDESPESVEPEGYVAREERVRTSFAAPPESTALTPNNSLWIDRKRQRVYLDGYVAMQRGSLEMFACPVGTKEHESIVATLAKSREVHAALLAIKALPGTPVQYVPDFVPATGQVIRVWICWRDAQNKFQVSDARKWIRKNGTQDELKAEWVFAGSSIWKDPSDGRDYYQADGGDMICVSNFSTAMLDVTISSSAEADGLQYEPYEKRIPEIGTPVRIILAPVPNPSDDPNAKPEFDPNQPPTETVLPKGKSEPGSDATSQPKPVE